MVSKFSYLYYALFQCPSFPPTEIVHVGMQLESYTFNEGDGIAAVCAEAQGNLAGRKIEVGLFTDNPFLIPNISIQHRGKIFILKICN